MESSNATQAEFQAAREPKGPPDITVWQQLRGYKADPVERWTRIRREYGDVARYRFGLFDTFLIGTAEGAKRILQDNVPNYTKDHPSYGMIRRLVGNGLLTSEGSFWLRQRRLAQPAFHRQRIAEMGTLMTAAASELADQWDARVSNGAPISMLQDMSRLTMRVVGDALFGTAVAEKTARISAAWDLLNTQMVERFRSLRLIPPILPTRYDRDFRNARKTMFRVVDEIIADKRRQQTESGDLLSLLMHARDEDTGEQMTDAQLRDEVVTMVLAGHETTSIALSWSWALLAQHPTADQALRAELRQVLAGRVPTAADFPSLRLTRAVVDEAMRLHPPVWILNRRIKENDVISGHRVYKGGVALVTPVLLHRHPDYWERPDEFVPERWLDAEAEKKRPRYAYLPFSGGPRQCIGNNFAMMEAVLVLATLAQRFQPRLESGFVPRPEFLVTQRPSAGLPMRLERAASVGDAPLPRAG